MRNWRTYLLVATIAAICSFTATMFVLHTNANAETVTDKNPDKLYLCTGKEGGNYKKAGNILKNKAPFITVVETLGSVDNLEKMLNGECDAAFVQADALITFADRYAAVISEIETTGPLYKEYMHLICNKNAGIKSVTDLTEANTVAIGEEGTGAAVTWGALVKASKAGWFTDKKYDAIQTVNSNNTATLLKADAGDDVQCVVSISSFGSNYIKEDVASYDNLKLTAVDDEDILEVKDRKGKSVYEIVEIPSDTYESVMPSGWLGNKSIDTIGVDALFITSKQWINAHGKDYDKLARAYTQARKEIRALVGQ